MSLSGGIQQLCAATAGNPVFLFGGIILVVAAIVFDALAYRLREAGQQAMSRRGLVLSLITGLLMGTFYRFVSRSMSGEHAPRPYAAVFFFAIGVAVCAIPVNYLLMRLLLDGRQPAAMGGNWRAPGTWHLWGMMGGAIWCAGALMNFLAAQAHLVGPAVSYSIGQGATMISAA